MKLQNNIQPSKVEQPVNNYTQPAPNKNSKNTIIIIAVVLGGLLLAAITFGGMYFIQQYKLKQVDKELQEQAGDLDTKNQSPGDNKDNDSQEKVTKYNVGDAVTLLDGSKRHIVSVNGDDVVLLSDTLAKESSGYGRDASYESQKYENSIIKEFIDNEYTPGLKSSLENKGANVNDLVVRLITVEEYLNLSNTEFYVSSDIGNVCNNTTIGHYDLSDENYSDVPSFLGLTDSYWTMDNYKDYASSNSSCTYKGYHGAYYVENKISSFDTNSGSLQLMMDDDALGNVNFDGTFVGIRPVIETSIKNIK